MMRENQKKLDGWIQEVMDQMHSRKYLPEDILTLPVQFPSPYICITWYRGVWDFRKAHKSFSGQPSQLPWEMGCKGTDPPPALLLSASVTRTDRKCWLVKTKGPEYIRRTWEWDIPIWAGMFFRISGAGGVPWKDPGYSWKPLQRRFIPAWIQQVSNRPRIQKRIPHPVRQAPPTDTSPAVLFYGKRDYCILPGVWRDGRCGEFKRKPPGVPCYVPASVLLRAPL